MRNALQEQLLKAGLAKKGKIDKIVRDKAKQRRGKSAPEPAPAISQAERQRQQRVERDRALEAERRAQAQAHERQAQVRQIIEQNRLTARGDDAYRFPDGNLIRSVLIDPAMRPQLAKGSLVIVRAGDEDYAILPRAAGDQIAQRQPELVVLDHSRTQQETPASDDDDEYYSRFVVPDDLVW